AKVLRCFVDEPAEYVLKPGVLCAFAGTFTERLNGPGTEAAGTIANELETRVGNSANAAIPKTVGQQQEDVWPTTGTKVLTGTKELQERLALLARKRDTAIHGPASGIGKLLVSPNS